MKKYLGVSPDIVLQKYIHGYYYKYCPIGACDGQGEVETVI